MAIPVRTFLHRVVLNRGDNWFAPGEEQSGTAFEEYGRHVCSVAGTWYNLRTVGTAAVGQGRNTKLRTEVTPGAFPFADTLLACDLTAPNTSDSVHVDAGAVIAWRNTHTGPFVAGSDVIQFSVDFEPDNQGETPYFWITPTHSGSTRWVQMFTGTLSGTSGSNPTWGDLVAVPCVLTRYDPMGWCSPMGPGVGASYLFTVYVNGVPQDGSGGTVDTRCSFTGSAYTTTWTGALPLARGDYVQLKIEAVGSPRSMAIGCGSCLLSTLPGLYNIFVTDITNSSSTLARYRGLDSRITFEGTEADVKNLGGLTDLRLSGMIAKFQDGNIGTGAFITLDLRRNEGNVTGAPQIIATGNVPSGIFEGSLDEFVVIGSSDYVSWRHLPSPNPPNNTPAISTLSIGLRGGTPYIPSLMRGTQFFMEWATSEDTDLDPPAPELGCTGGGEVATSTNPAEGTSIDNVLDLLIWMEITTVTSPSSTLYLSKIGIPFGPPKRGLVDTFGQAVLRLPDRDGGLQTSKCRTVVVDEDGSIAAAWAAGELRGASVEYFAASEATVRAEGVPWRLWRGFISGVEPEGDGKVALVVEDVLTHRFNGIDGEDLQVPTETYADQFGTLTLQDRMYGQAIPHLYGEISEPGGAWEMPFVGSSPAAEGGSPSYAVLGALHWFGGMRGVNKINEIFTASLGAAPTQRIQLPESSFPGVWKVPRRAGWVEVTDYSLRNGRAYTAIAGLPSSPAVRLAKDFRIPLVVNLCGYPEDGVGESSPWRTINGPARVLQHFLTHFVLDDVAVGNVSAIASENGYSLLDADTFETVHQALEALGMLAAGAIGGDFTQGSWRDVTGDLCRQFGFDLSQNRHGQVILTWLDRTDAAEDAPEFDENKILDGTARLNLEAGRDVENVIRSVHRKNYVSTIPELAPPTASRLPLDPDKGAWISGELTSQSDASITALGGDPSVRHSKGHRPSELQEQWMIRDDDTAQLVRERRRDLWSPPDGRLHPDATILLAHGARLVPGQVVKLKHRDYPWSGYRRCQARELVVDMDAQTLGIGARDVDDLLP